MVGRIPLKTSLVIGVIALVIGTLEAVPPAFAGGTVTGTVVYTGKGEEQKWPIFRSARGWSLCAKIGTDGHKPHLITGYYRIIRTIEVGKGGALKAAVVAVTDIEDSVWMNDYKGTEVTVRFCEFEPYTGVVVNQRNVRVTNTEADPDNPKLIKGVPHSPHAYEATAIGPYSSRSHKFEDGSTYISDYTQMKNLETIFNMALPEKGSTIDRQVILRKQGTFFVLLCESHPWEFSYFLPVASPYYAVTDADGKFTIMNVPAGKHKLLVWHPFAGQIEADVEVRDGTTVTANFQIKK